MNKKLLQKWQASGALIVKLSGLLTNKDATPGVKREAERLIELNKQFNNFMITGFDHSIRESRRLLADHEKNCAVLKQKEVSGD